MDAFLPAQKENSMSEPHVLKLPFWCDNANSGHTFLVKWLSTVSGAEVGKYVMEFKQLSFTRTSSLNGFNK